MDKLRREAIDKMCAALEGTCLSAAHYQSVHGFGELTEEEQEYMDEIIFQCPNCGWWCRSDDMIDGQCVNCYEEELEEENENG